MENWPLQELSSRCVSGPYSQNSRTCATMDTSIQSTKVRTQTGYECDRIKNILIQCIDCDFFFFCDVF